MYYKKMQNTNKYLSIFLNFYVTSRLGQINPILTSKM
jgi:hypothetical protein